MSNSEKRFVTSSCREIEGQFWSFFNINISKEDFMKLPTDWSWFVKLTLSKKKEKDQWGNTHYLVLNTYEKKEKSDVREVLSSQDDDLPF